MMKSDSDSFGYDLAISIESKNILRKIPVEMLDIPNRAKNILRQNGVDNALKAIEIIKSHFTGLPRIGIKTIIDSNRSVDELLLKIRNVEPDQILNILDPRESYLEHVNGNIIQALPAIFNLYFEKREKKNKERNKDILCKRFNLDEKGEYTLEDIGTYYDLTRERVRQIEAKTISELNLLLSGRLNTKGWRLDQEIINNYIALTNELKNRDFILSTIELESLFNDYYGYTISNGFFRILMEALNYIKLPSHIDGFRGTMKSSWCAANRFNRKEIESIYQSLDIVFDYADPIRVFDLIVKAKKKFKGKISNESLHIALKSCEEVEVDDELIAIKFNYLKSASDKAYRLLSSKNKPLHYSEICKEINLLERSTTKPSNITTPTNLKNQMVSDERFKPIGRSGEWGLSKWSDIQNITIVQAIESILHKSGSPLSFSEISKGVKQIRPDASKRSFTVYLASEPNKFMKVGEDLYALTAWGMKPLKRRKINKISNETFYEVAREILAQRNPIPLPKFIEKMSNKTGLKDMAIRKRIINSPIIKTQETDNRYKEVYCDDISFSLEAIGLTKTTLREKVQHEIRSILYENPNKPFKKGDLYNLVNKEIPCIKPTFYHYLEETRDIKQYKEGNHHFAVYEHTEKDNAIEINLGEYNIDPSLMARLIRPISMLDIENVDIALFELGLIFENELKSYLMEARNNSTITVRQNDLKRLSSMIDCVVREGVVTKGHHLSTLREERNARAHGNQPSLDERKQLFNKAHYVAELFIRYIAFFNKVKCEIIDV